MGEEARKAPGEGWERAGSGLGEGWERYQMMDGAAMDDVGSFTNLHKYL